MWTLLVPLLALVAAGGGATFGANKALLDCASQILYMEQHTYDIPTDYNRNIPPGKNTTVFIGLNVNRVSGVDENKEEITLDVFLQVSWEDPRLKVGMSFIDLPWEFRQLIWTPDLYIWQLQTMRILSVLQEMASLRLYKNSTVSVSIGATIIIKCEMDFVLYPLDVQKCYIDFSSCIDRRAGSFLAQGIIDGEPATEIGIQFAEQRNPSNKNTADTVRFEWREDLNIFQPFADKHTAEAVRFEWREIPPWIGWRQKGGQRNQFRLPKYVVSFTTDKSKHIAHYGEGDHSAARLNFTLSRELRGYLLESYLPSSLFVIISWGSFCVIPEIVPGRMVLLVTTLLSLVTMFDTVSTNSPDALELKCIEVWLISCTIFVFLALLEYFVVLFGIRYDKSWCRRRQDLRRAASAAQLGPPPLHVNHSQRLSCTPVTGTPQGGVFSPKLSVEDEGLQQQFSHQTIQRDSPPIMDTMGRSGSEGLLWRLGACMDKGIMFCGAQHGALDRYALMIFPMCFVLFTIIYWTAYLNEASKASHK